MILYKSSCFDKFGWRVFQQTQEFFSGSCFGFKSGTFNKNGDGKCRIKHPKVSATSEPRLLARIRNKCRLLHYSIRTESAYVNWVISDSVIRSTTPSINLMAVLAFRVPRAAFESNIQFCDSDSSFCNGSDECVGRHCHDGAFSKGRIVQVLSIWPMK